MFELQDDELEALLAEMEAALVEAAAREQADALAAAEDADLAALVQDFQAAALGSPRVPCPGARAPPIRPAFKARNGVGWGVAQEWCGAASLCRVKSIKVGVGALNLGLGGRPGRPGAGSQATALGSPRVLCPEARASPISL